MNASIFGSVLFGIKSHEWAALSLAVTWWDLRMNGGAPSSVSPVEEYQR